VNAETNEPHLQQHIYLLSIWRTQVDQPWRVALRQAGGVEIQHFPSLNALVATLAQQLKGTEEDAAQS
jgi:hypothetical protein